MRNILSYLVILLFSGPLFPQASDVTFEISVSKYLMGTVVELTARYPNIDKSKKAAYFAFKEMERVENLLSYQKSESEISRINRSAGIKPLKVSAETFAVLQRAKSYGERLDGWFDVTIGPVSELWGFSSEREIVIPPAEDIVAAQRLVDYHHLILNEQDTTAFLSEKGMKIDLGGIAKGYATDRGVLILKQQGIRQFLLNAGGDIYACGMKEAGEKWSIGVKHPRKLNDLIATMKLSDYAVATSGDYERYIDIEGQRYHHILNPRSGYPSKLCRSVTVLAETAEEADVLATYLFVIGYDALFAVHKENILYLMIDSRGIPHYNPILMKEYELTLIP